jgi:hypothetical protein
MATKNKNTKRNLLVALVVLDAVALGLDITRLVRSVQGAK